MTIATTTARDLCISALRKAGITGVGQAPAAEDINDAFTDMNDMLAQWQRQRWLIWCLNDTAWVADGISGGQAQPVTVGPGQQFNIPRPDRIEGAYFRQLTNVGAGLTVDFPLDLLEDYTDYAERVALKGLVSFPTFACYRPNFPIGNLFIYPIPSDNLYEIHILTKAVLAAFANLSSQVILPPEYNAAIKWNLTVRLRASYDLPNQPAIIKLAKEALNIIRGANTQIGRLQIPQELVRPGLYNVFSDQVY